MDYDNVGSEELPEGVKEGLLDGTIGAIAMIFILVVVPVLVLSLA
jgi:hypothetical protein